MPAFRIPSSKESGGGTAWHRWGPYYYVAIILDGYWGNYSRTLFIGEYIVYLLSVPIASLFPFFFLGL